MITDDRDKRSNLPLYHFFSRYSQFSHSIFTFTVTACRLSRTIIIVIKLIYSMNSDVMTCLITLFSFGDIRNRHWKCIDKHFMRSIIIVPFRNNKFGWHFNMVLVIRDILRWPCKKFRVVRFSFFDYYCYYFICRYLH